MTKPNYYSGKKKASKFSPDLWKGFFTSKDEEPEPVDWKRQLVIPSETVKKCR